MQKIAADSLAFITQYSRSAGRAYPHSTPQNTLFPTAHHLYAHLYVLPHITISNPQGSYPSISTGLTSMPTHF